MSTFRSAAAFPLKRRKRPAENHCPAYAIIAPDGTVVGDAVMTGVAGRDDYPWDWTLTEGVATVDARGRRQGVTDTLTAAIDQIRSILPEGTWAR